MALKWQRWEKAHGIGCRCINGFKVLPMIPASQFRDFAYKVLDRQFVPDKDRLTGVS